jgi:uncharacterized membrane protein YtjA (UPF0391 family)
MLKNKKLVYRVVAVIWFVVGILSIAGGTYRIALLMFIMAVLFFLLSNWKRNGSTSESSEEEQE